jgi:uncharacterized protein (DUF2252 family)
MTILTPVGQTETSRSASHPSYGVAPDDFDARRRFGRSSRRRSPRTRHGEWSPAPDRADPVALLEEQAATRVPELVPIRYGRMMVSPFAFFRGAALIMAADLAGTPTSGIEVQLCGDAHLSNFGVFATPERRMVFDINDFDETLPGPWEWDLKRLAASFEVMGRFRGFSPSARRAVTRAAARSYRERMRAAADEPVLDAWYDHLEADQLLRRVREARKSGEISKKQVRRTAEVVAKAHTHDSSHLFAKLVRVVDGRPRIIADPPLITPLEDLLPEGVERELAESAMRELIKTYRSTIPVDFHPVEEFRFVHMARKVVGVGSVGTRAWVLLLEGRDSGDPLLLQAKEAEASVLERFLGESVHSSHGERVVRGQRLMQSASDIFLGWQGVVGVEGRARDFYVRQLHDWKGSIEADQLVAKGAMLYAQICGETLARAHARSGDRVAIAAYLGLSDRFDQAISEFADAYADQNQRDYDAFIEAVGTGRLHAQPGL